MGRVLRETISENISCSDSVNANILQKIELSSDIPVDAKQAIKNFLKECWDSTGDINNIPIPQEVIDNWEVIMQIIKSLS